MDRVERHDMIEAQVQEAQPQIYSVKAVTVPYCSFSGLQSYCSYRSCLSSEAAISVLFEELHPPPLPNTRRLSGTARSLTFGAQNG